MPEHLTFNAEQERERSLLRKSRAKSDEWPNKWGWLLDEQLKLRETLAKAKGIVPEDTKDKRVLKPIPITTNGIYGWILSQPDFSLKCGGDRPIMKKLPKIFDLQTNLYYR